MSGSLLSYGLMAAGVFDIVLGSLAYWNVNKLAEICPFWISSDEKYTRLAGCFIALCGICRLHGGLNITEKGAYRVCLWSFIVEFFFHAMEVHLGFLTFEATKPVYLITGVSALVMTLRYKAVLYPDGTKKKK